MSSRYFRVACEVILWACGVLSLIAVPAVHSQAAKNQKKHLILSATVAPSDPFSDLNKVGRPADKMAFARGSTFLVTISGSLLDEWYTYPLTQRAPEQEIGQLAKISVDGPFQLLDPAQESEPEWKTVPNLPPELIHKNPFSWTQEVYIKPDAPEGKSAALTLTIKAQVCKKSCTLEDHVLQIPIAIAAGSAMPPSEQLAARLAEKPPAPTILPLPVGLGKTEQGKTPTPPSDSKPNKGGPTGLLASIFTAIGGGFISLLTPCVFPMIPITVSYFLKQAETRKQPAVAGSVENAPRSYSPLLLAAVYSGTIVLVLAAGGLALLEVMVKISTHPVTNFVIGGLFLFFALSLLGWYDITLPGWLQDLTSRGENKGGLVGVFFMALTFSIISFACVGPIYGSFVALQASSSGALGFLQRALPVVAYSAAFASPFFFLALFPTMLKAMPRAGSWMNSVKVVMGFLELAAVVKFVRAGELAWSGKADLLSYDLSMGLYVAICLACGLYLFGFYRLPHDHETPETIGVPRLMFSLAFLTLGFYLLPAIFKGDGGESQRPSGTVFAWIDSFLLPDPEPAIKPGSKNAGQALVWEHDLNEALAKAEREKKLVFLDFTGTLCTNCKLNERNVFPRPEVQQAFSKYVLLKLYTDTVPAGITQHPDANASLKLRSERFASSALPLYALLRPKGDEYEIVARFGEDGNGLIEDVPAFVKWLSQ